MVGSPNLPRPTFENKTQAKEAFSHSIGRRGKTCQVARLKLRVRPQLGVWGAASGRLVRLGAILYIVAAFQFIVCLAVVASSYGPPAYSPLSTTISDLQAVSCGVFQGARVCSPFHDLANFSVAALGLLMASGSLMVRPALPGGRDRNLAIWLLVVAGLASFANAFTPEDVTYTGDLVTALIAFLGANFGLIQMGKAMSTDAGWGRFWQFTEGLGVVGIAAIIIDGFGGASLLGNGGIEWLIVAPIIIWAPTMGLRLIYKRRPSEPATSPVLNDSPSKSYLRSN